MRRIPLDHWYALAAAILFAGSLEAQQWTRPDPARPAQPTAWMYKLGRLSENPQPQLHSAPYVIQEGAFGGRLFVVPAENVDLAAYLDQDIVVRGTLRPTANPRHKVFVVDRVFNRPDGARSPLSRLGGRGPTLEEWAQQQIEQDRGAASNSSAPENAPTAAVADGPMADGPMAEEPAAAGTEIVLAGAESSTSETGRDSNLAPGEPRRLNLSTITLRSLDEVAAEEKAAAAMAAAATNESTDAIIGSGLASRTPPPSPRAERPAGWEEVDVFGDRTPTAQQAAYRSRVTGPMAAIIRQDSRGVPGQGSRQPAVEELPPPHDVHGVFGDEYFEEYDPAYDHPGGTCTGCGGPTWDGFCSRGCGSPEWIWTRGEYLLWWTRGMDVPPLVTTSPNGTGQGTAGVVGQNGTTNLFGGSDVNDSSHSGFRLRAGTWLGDGKRLGIEGDYLWIDDQQTNFMDRSAGDPILARPYYDVVNGREAAVLVAYPNVARGRIDAEAITRFTGASARFRWNLFCEDTCYIPDVYPRIADGERIDWFAGYRYARLSDQITVNDERTQSTSTFEVHDQFISGNEFHGAEVGFLYERRSGRWLVEGMTRIALGNNHQVVNINGRTEITNNSGTQTYAGGLLAQSSNMGFYTRDELSVIPELGMTVGYQLTNHTRLICGYSFLYFSNVVRAGDQIDRDVNTRLMPPGSPPVTGTLRPAFAFRETDFWAQGINLGVDIRF